MNDYFTALPGLMTDVADLFGSLDLAALPPLSGVALDYSHTAGTWRVSGQLASVEDEAGEIDAIRAWAAALAAEVHLRDRFEAHGIGTAFRGLEAVKALEGGASLRIWTHIDQSPLAAAVGPVAVAA